MLEVVCVCVCVCVQHIDIKTDSSARSNSTTSTSQVRQRAHYVDYVTVVLLTRGDETSRLVLLYAQELR
jgi:hypothetical protein